MYQSLESVPPTFWNGLSPLLSRKQQEHEREPSNTPKPSVSSDEQSSQRVHGSKTTKRNSVTTRSGRAIKPPEYLMNSYER